jgi:hypothetical protein
MTDIDPNADIGIAYRGDGMLVVITLDGPVTEMWCRRYEALAGAREVYARAYEKAGQAWLHLTVPTGAGREEVLAMLDVARTLIADADAVDQSPATSDAPEAVVREWWARQQV